MSNVLEEYEKEIQRETITKQLFAHKCQASEVRKKLLELKKNEHIFQQQMNEINERIREYESALSQLGG